MDNDSFLKDFFKNDSKRALADKIAFCDKGFLPPETIINKAKDNGWQTRTAKWAKRNGFIAAPNLVCLFAYDETYIKILPKIWEDFQMNIDGDECPDPSTFDSRINIWTALLHRWIQNEILEINRENQQFFGVQDKIRKDRELKYEVQGENDIYIKMDELERHFTELVKAPLPKILSRITEQTCLPKKRWPNEVSPVCTEIDIDWQNVTIKFMGNEEILIQYGTEHTERRFNQAGFENCKNGKPIKSWVDFIGAAERKEIPFNTRNRKTVEKTAQILNKKLSVLFPNLPKNPIKLNTEKDGYRFAFQIEASEQ